MNKENAKNSALSWYPIKGMIVKSVSEIDNAFVVCLTSSDSAEDYIGGGIRVDKTTGKCSLYNPMLEVNNA